MTQEDRAALFSAGQLVGPFISCVVGSKNSSNSNRLREVAQNMGVDAYMVDSAAGLKPEWIAGKARVGVTAGASAPEVLVNELIGRLKELGATSVRPLEGLGRTGSRAKPGAASPGTSAASPAPR